MAHWLLKSEPDVFSYDDLVRAKREGWDGIRSYQSRNFLREMQVGEEAIFYHSNAKPPGRRRHLQDRQGRRTRPDAVRSDEQVLRSPRASPRIRVGTG